MSIGVFRALGEVSSGRFATNDVGLRRDQMSGGQCGKPQRAVNSFPILGPVPAPFESGNKNLPSLVFPTDTGFYFLESIGYRLSFESLSSSFSAFGSLSSRSSAWNAGCKRGHGVQPGGVSFANAWGVFRCEIFALERISL